MREYKLCVCGLGAVGKSAIAYDATIEDSYRKFIRIDEEDCRLEVLDTAGTEQFSGMRDLYVKSAQGFILVYSIEDEHSFRQIESIADHIFRIKGGKVPMVIVGNKSDLCQSLRRIPTADGKTLAQKLRCNFFETSAKLNENISEVFLDAVRQIRQQGGGEKKGRKKEKNDCCVLL